MWNPCKIFFRSFDVSGRIQGGSFLKKKKNNCGFVLWIHHPRCSTYCIFNENWFVFMGQHSVKLSQGFCHCSVSSSDSRQESRFQIVVSSLSRCSTYHVLPQLLQTLWGQRGGLESAIGQTALENYTGNAIHGSTEWISRRAECREEGEEKGETERYPPNTAVPEAQMAYSACHPSSLFQGYHRSNHFIATQGEYPSKAIVCVYVCVCVCMQDSEYLLWLCNKLKMIQPMSLLMPSPLPKPSLWKIQRCVTTIPWRLR